MRIILMKQEFNHASENGSLKWKFQSSKPMTNSTNCCGRQKRTKRSTPFRLWYALIIFDHFTVFLIRATYSQVPECTAAVGMQLSQCPVKYVMRSTQKDFSLFKAAKPQEGLMIREYAVVHRWKVCKFGSLLEYFHYLHTHTHTHTHCFRYLNMIPFGQCMDNTR